MPVPDICDADIWGSAACSADRATATLLALECASRMSPNFEYFNTATPAAVVPPDKSKHKEEHSEGNKDMSARGDEQLPAFWRLLRPENYTWKWILDLDDLQVCL